MGGTEEKPASILFLLLYWLFPSMLCETLHILHHTNTDYMTTNCNTVNLLPSSSFYVQWTLFTVSLSFTFHYSLVCAKRYHTNMDYTKKNLQSLFTAPLARCTLHNFCKTGQTVSRYTCTLVCTILHYRSMSSVHCQHHALCEVHWTLVYCALV